ncbi:hypothetical protein [Roseovarius sp. EL26]|uniref:hypothetical protein n=1 Tax=Roseovarius sp. EL26 TaxID=2126672 RepID=UPI000EA0C34C|nr:hypothetical protein [Roseovarius sp. EL26]
MIRDFSILGAFGLAWGYDPSKPTPARSANEEVAAFEEHAARGIRHYLLSKFVKYTLPVVLIAPVFLTLSYWKSIGVFGIFLGVTFGCALIYGYARLVWHWFRK